jgi:hypothetical protein
MIATRSNQSLPKGQGNRMKTTISILSPVEHEILDWAINSDFLEEAKGNFPSDWNSWDRKGVLNSRQLVIDWQTPHIAPFTAFLLLRLQNLYADARDKYAEAAKNLEKRISCALKSHSNSRPSCFSGSQTDRNSD